MGQLIPAKPHLESELATHTLLKDNSPATLLLSQLLFFFVLSGMGSVLLSRHCCFAKFLPLLEVLLRVCLPRVHHSAYFVQFSDKAPNEQFIISNAIATGEWVRDDNSGVASPKDAS